MEKQSIDISKGQSLHFCGFLAPVAGLYTMLVQWPEASLTSISNSLCLSCRVQVRCCTFGEGCRRLFLQHCNLLPIENTDLRHRSKVDLLTSGKKRKCSEPQDSMDSPGSAESSWTQNEKQRYFLRLPSFDLVCIVTIFKAENTSIVSMPIEKCVILHLDS